MARAYDWRTADAAYRDALAAGVERETASRYGEAIGYGIPDDRAMMLAVYGPLDAADESRQEAIDLADMMDAGLPVDAWDGASW